MLYGGGGEGEGGSERERGGEREVLVEHSWLYVLT